MSRPTLSTEDMMERKKKMEERKAKGYKNQELKNAIFQELNPTIERDEKDGYQESETNSKEAKESLESGKDANSELEKCTESESNSRFSVSCSRRTKDILNAIKLYEKNQSVYIDKAVIEYTKNHYPQLLDFIENK